jgi:hypothetical protein
MLKPASIPTLTLTGAKGLATDSLPNNQPPDTYRFAEDINLNEDLTHESLRRPQLSHTLPGDALGLWPLNGETIVFYRAGAGKGGVGALVLDRVTQQSTFTVIWESDILLLAGQVKMRTRLDYRGHRIVYFTDGVNPVRKLDLDGPRPTEADDMNLILHNPLPSASGWEVLDGGSLTAGVYQVLARLLTTSKVGTPFSLGTPLIPLSARPSTAPWPQQDGGLERAGSEQLRVTITSIAPGFRYVQLAVIFYDPYTLTPTVRLQEPVEIDPTQTEASLLVTKLPDTEISTSQLTTEAVNIKTVDLLCVAKQSLLLGGVTVQRADGFDWQGVANKVAVYWTTKKLTTVPPKPNITKNDDTSPSSGPPPLYYDTITAAEFRSLQRGEVYSLSISPIIEGERTQAAFPIPAGYGTGPNATTVWQSQERYPVGRGFPVEVGGTRPAFIRHHQMPSLREAPLTDAPTPFSFDNNISAINVLGLRVELPPDLLSMIPAEIQKRLKGFRILRQPRPVEQSTILASGLAQTMIKGESVLYPSPFSGWWYNHGGETGWSSQGDDNDFTTADHEYSIVKNRLAFYSLDTLMGGVDATLAQQVHYAALLNGRAWLVDSQRSNSEDDEDEGVKYGYSFVNATQVDASGLANMPTRTYPLDQNITQTIGAGDQYASDINVGDQLGSYSIRNQNGYVLLGLDNTSGSYGSGFPVQHIRREFIYANRTNRTDEIFGIDQQGNSLNQDQLAGRVIPSTRYLVQLRRPLPGQYGRIEQATYFAVGTVAAADSASADVYRGDVFVQPCALLLSSQERRWNYDKEESNVNGPVMRQLIWFTCESRVNAGRRHFDAPKAGAQGTLPYYPLLKSLTNDAGTGLFQLPTTGGHAVGYNKSYSLEEKVTLFFPRLLSSDAIVEAFRNRTYYTPPLIEGALSDDWQTVLADNYYDLPATHGYLTDLFVQAGVLFQRTQQTLYRAFFKETTFQNTSSGQAMLGTGLAFAQPSEEVRKADDGYAGGAAAGSCDALTGRVLVDPDRLQLFSFNGEAQELLRPKGCIDALRQLLATGPITAGAYHPVDKSFAVYTKTRGLIFSLSGEQFVGFSKFGADLTCTTSEHVILAQGPKLLNLSFGEPSTESRVRFVSVPLGGSVEAVYYNMALHGSPLPARLALNTPTQQQTRTLRLHQGLRDVYRNQQELVARLFDEHYNYELPVDEQGAFLSGNYLQFDLTWDKPVTWRMIQLWAQVSGVTQG